MVSPSTLIGPFEFDRALATRPLLTCDRAVQRFLEVAVGFRCFEYEKPAKNRFFKLFVISPVQ